MLGFYSQKAFLSWHPSKAVAVAAVAAAEHGKERKGGNFHYDMDCRNGTTTTGVQLLTA